ncbi:MAG TPA: sigma-70 family RNA polymerase sigma factor [Solirubrobacteraceae bacterium]|nr:sigma-70 family RNA polymerase sigma factor [Solirubrobacteraceae bacterium]
MEASAVRAPVGPARRPLVVPLLRLRTDEQLLALFRAGSDEAFRVIHDRYRQRLFAYVRQMLWRGQRQDAEDLLQDVFVRAYGALRSDTRDVNLRAWLYRVAHNRCIDHLRRPVPAAADVFEVSRKPLRDPIEEAQRREDLARLVEDVGRLPEQQRSALLMREMDGMSYADLAVTLDVTVPAVKSLLVRARVGLVEAAEARDADCHDIRADLAASCDRGVKASARARKHLRHCRGCREYRTALRGVRRSFAALNAGPLALAFAKLVGLGSGSAATGGGTAVGVMTAGGGGGAAVGGSVAACKVAAAVCTAALTAGGAVEVRERVRHRDAPAEPARVVSAPVAAPAPPAPAVVERRVRTPRPAVAPAVEEKPARDEPEPVAEPVAEEEPLPLPDAGETGGVEAPGDEPVPAEDENPVLADDEPAAGDGGSGPTTEPEITAEPAAAPASQPPPPSRR